MNAWIQRQSVVNHLSTYIQKAHQNLQLIKCKKFLIKMIITKDIIQILLVTQQLIVKQKLKLTIKLKSNGIHIPSKLIYHRVTLHILHHK